MISISVNGVAYEVPSSAADVSWAAKQVAFEQALAAGVNGTSDSSQTFTVANAGVTIPSDSKVVFLKTTGGSYTMAGTPIIQNGEAAGQRVLLVMHPDTAGSVTFTTGGNVAPVYSTFTLSYINPSQAAMEFVWTGDTWVTASMPAVWPQQVPIPETFVTPTTAQISVIDDGVALPLAGNVSTYLVSGTAGIEITLGQPSIDAGQDGQEILLMNNPTNAELVILKDEGTLSGTTLRLSSGTINLTPGSSVRLHWVDSQSIWYEVAKTILV